jgi:hypothetical protein
MLNYFQLLFLEKSLIVGIFRFAIMISETDIRIFSQGVLKYLHIKGIAYVSYSVMQVTG